MKKKKKKQKYWKKNVEKYKCDRRNENEML